MVEWAVLWDWCTADHGLLGDLLARVLVQPTLAAIHSADDWHSLNYQGKEART